MPDSNVTPEAPNSPIGLLAMGYGTAGLMGFLFYLFDGGTLASVLIFWLGGAVAALGWAVAWACLPGSAMDRRGLFAENLAAAEAPSGHSSAHSHRAA